MCDLLDIHDGMNILEIGTGSGYHAAVMAVLAGSGHIYTVERIESLALFARDNLKKAGFKNVNGYRRRWFSWASRICALMIG